MTRKPLINLWDMKGIGVLIPYPSGVLYSNQVGGHACMKPQVEGVYAPLVSEIVDQEKLLYDHFSGPKWLSWCAYGIDEEDANVIDHILELVLTTSFIKVDRTRLQDSWEAWIYVDIGKQPDEIPMNYRSDEGTGTTASGETLHSEDYDLDIIFYPFFGFGNCKGILTWTSS